MIGLEERGGIFKGAEHLRGFLSLVYCPDCSFFLRGRGNQKVAVFVQHKVAVFIQHKVAVAVQHKVAVAVQQRVAVAVKHAVKVVTVLRAKIGRITV